MRTFGRKKSTSFLIVDRPELMKQLHLQLSDQKKALYLKIADAIRAAIRTGQLKPGEKLPSTRRLAEELQVHRHTLMNALNELVAEGWLEARQRQGYLVSEQLPAEFLGVERQANVKRAPHVWSIEQDFLLQDLPDHSNYEFSFRSGAPDLRLFPYQEFKSHLADTLRVPAPELLDYGNPAGHEPLIQQLEIFLRRMRGIQGKKIVMTHGSQEALYLAARLLVKPGDYVAVENQGYPSAWGAFKAAGAQLLPIEVDEGGLCLESLERQIKKQPVRFIYITPLHQYPTTSTLSVSRRMQLYEIASREGIPIVEDDYDHEYHYRCQPLPPLAAEDPAERVIYISTFSKVLFPASRLGFMAVPEGLYSALVAYRKILSQQNETLLQDAVARWMESGGLERHLRKMCKVYEQRRNFMAKQLMSAQESGLKLSFKLPDGGMAFWVNCFQDSGELAERAKRRGIFVHPEWAFHVDQKPGTHLRLGFAGQNQEEIQRGLKALFDLWRTPD